MITAKDFFKADFFFHRHERGEDVRQVEGKTFFAHLGKVGFAVATAICLGPMNATEVRFHREGVPVEQVTMRHAADDPGPTKMLRIVRVTGYVQEQARTPDRSLEWAAPDLGLTFEEDEYVTEA